MMILLNVNSSVSRVNDLWLADITNHRTDKGKLNQCTVKDVHSNRIVGHSIDNRMKESQAVAAVRNAVMLHSLEGIVVHSDRNSFFCLEEIVQTLGNNNPIDSMGRIGACADNAAMELFFALLQKNVLEVLFESQY
jgi:putative transposase